MSFKFDESWLEQQTSVEEQGDDFGLIQDQWDALRSQMIAGDELWTYGRGSGLSCEGGLALRRNGHVIAKIITMQS